MTTLIVCVLVIAFCLIAIAAIVAKSRSGGLSTRPTARTEPQFTPSTAQSPIGRLHDGEALLLHLLREQTMDLRAIRRHTGLFYFLTWLLIGLGVIAIILASAADL